MTLISVLEAYCFVDLGRKEMPSYKFEEVAGPLPFQRDCLRRLGLLFPGGLPKDLVNNAWFELQQPLQEFYNAFMFSYDAGPFQDPTPELRAE